MFCPQCGSTQNDELKFCKSCGANLHALRQLMATRETDAKFDWSKTWLADMLVSVGDDDARPDDSVERQRKATPEAQRQKEIKAGVVTASVGLGVMILLFVLMEGIIAGGRVSEAAAAILSRLWIVGVLPLLVGSALVFNGVFVSRKGVGLIAKGNERETKELKPVLPEDYAGPTDTSQLPSGIPFSVTEEATHNLEKKLP